jgi:hypothetical protein
MRRVLGLRGGLRRGVRRSRRLCGSVWLAMESGVGGGGVHLEGLENLEFSQEASMACTLLSGVVECCTALWHVTSYHETWLALRGWLSVFEVLALCERR